MLREIAVVEQAVLAKPAGGDQKRIPGESRVARIRGVPVADGAERQYLPEALACAPAKIEEFFSLPAEVADAVRARQ